MDSLKDMGIKFLIVTLIVGALTMGKSSHSSPEYITAAELITQKRYEEALPHLKRSIDLEPKRVLGYVLRASAYNGIGEYENALSDCEKALNLNPQEPRAYLKRAYALIKLSRYADAVDACTRAIVLNPTLAQAFEYRAEAHKKIGNDEVAIQDLSKARELNDYGSDFCRSRKIGG